MTSDVAVWPVTVSGWFAFLNVFVAMMVAGRYLLLLRESTLEEREQLRDQEQRNREYYADTQKRETELARHYSMQQKPFPERAEKEIVALEAEWDRIDAAISDAIVHVTGRRQPVSMNLRSIPPATPAEAADIAAAAAEIKAKRAREPHMWQCDKCAHTEIVSDDEVAIRESGGLGDLWQSHWPANVTMAHTPDTLCTGRMTRLGRAR